MDNKIIVDSIKKICKDHYITVSQLEKEIGLSQGLVSKWMNTTPSLDKIIDIADYFHVSIDEVIGYKQKDVFLNILCDLTNNKEIKWFIINKDTDKNVAIPHKVFPYEYYDEEIYTEKSYFTKYKEGYIIIYSFYDNGKFINPNELSLYIQPSSDKLDYALQYYSTTDLKPLWIKILSNMDEIPIEVKAETFKDIFINEFKNKINTQNSPKKKKKIIFVSNPHNTQYLMSLMEHNVFNDPNGCVLYDIINRTTIDKDENRGITSIGKDFYTKHKDSLDNITKAKMIDGKILMLISDNRIMKLSGFSSGKQHGHIGYDGLLYVLNDAGFDTSDESIINKENFNIDK